MKLVEGSEFDVSKRTVMATKLLENDRVVSIVATGIQQTMINDGIPDDDMGMFDMSGGSGDDAGQMEFDMFMDAGMGYEEAQTFDIVVLQTNDGIFLRFRLEEIPEKKKGAVGVKGIKLNEDDYVSKVYVIDAGDNTVVECNGKQVSLRNLKTNKRGAKGTKVRGK